MYFIDKILTPNDSWQKSKAHLLVMPLKNTDLPVCVVKKPYKTSCLEVNEPIKK